MRKNTVILRTRPPTRTPIHRPSVPAPEREIHLPHPRALHLLEALGAKHPLLAAARGEMMSASTRGADVDAAFVGKVSRLPEIASRYHSAQPTARISDREAARAGGLHQVRDVVRGIVDVEGDRGPLHVVEHGLGIERVGELA